MGALAPELGPLELLAVPLVLLELALLWQREVPSWLMQLSAWQLALLSTSWHRQPCLERLLCLAYQQQRQQELPQLVELRSPRRSGRCRPLQATPQPPKRSQSSLPACWPR